MRQLVSVVDGDKLLYFVHDGDAVDQIAQIRNPGLSVPDVIELGASLAHLCLNGKSKPKHTRELPAAEPIVEIDGPRPMQRWGCGQAAVLDVLREHPNIGIAEIAQIITGVDDKRARAAVSATITELRRKRLISTRDVVGAKANEARATYTIRAATAGKVVDLKSTPISQRPKRTQTKWGTGASAVIDALHVLGPSSIRDIAQHITGGIDNGAQQSTAATISLLRNRGIVGSRSNGNLDSGSGPTKEHYLIGVESRTSD